MVGESRLVEVGDHLAAAGGAVVDQDDIGLRKDMDDPVEHPEFVGVDIGVDELGLGHQPVERRIRMVEVERLHPHAGVGEVVVEQGGDKAFADTALVLGKENDAFGGHGEEGRFSSCRGRSSGRACRHRGQPEAT